MNRTDIFALYEANLAELVDWTDFVSYRIWGERSSTDWWDFAAVTTSLAWMQISCSLIRTIFLYFLFLIGFDKSLICLLASLEVKDQQQLPASLRLCSSILRDTMLIFVALIGLKRQDSSNQPLTIFIRLSPSQTRSCSWFKSWKFHSLKIWASSVNTLISASRVKSCKCYHVCYSVIRIRACQLTTN